MDPKGLRGLIDEAKKRVGSGVVAMVAVNDGRATVAVGVTDDLTGPRNAVDLVRKAVEAVGGRAAAAAPTWRRAADPKAARRPRRSPPSAPRSRRRRSPPDAIQVGVAVQTVIAPACRPRISAHP